MSQFTRRACILSLASAALTASGSKGALSLGSQPEKPILTVSGAIEASNHDGKAEFDRPMLEALGMVTVETTTPWYSGPVKFEGIPLKAIMSTVGAKGDKIVAIALNDYSSEIPIEDVNKYGVILALKRDGDYMPVRDKGPLFIIYPYDSNPDLKTQTYYGRSVWQISRLVVK